MGQLEAYGKKMFSLQALTISIRYPPLLKAFEYSMDMVSDTLDLITNILTITPFIAATTLLADRLKVPGELRAHVMTLDQAALLPVRVIVQEGIETAANPLPNEWTSFKTLERWIKVGDFVRNPTIKRGWKVLFGSMWGRIMRLVLLVFTFGKMIGLLVCLWNYGKKIQDPTYWPVFFSGALTQKNPRQKQRVKIYRRVGGVKP